MYWIYCIENKMDGKKYVGKAKVPGRRWASHISISKKDTKYRKYIHRAIAKYGVDNFWFRCIDFALLEENALQKEKEYIKFFDTTDRTKGYNLTLGGEGKSGYKHTPETKRILSELAKQKTGAANPFYRKSHSNENKKKMSLSKIKITDAQVSYLISSYGNGNISLKILAQELNISIGHASDIINGKYRRK